MRNQKVTAAGLYALPPELYHGDCAPGPSLSSSGAVTLMRHCPARYWHDSYMNPARPDEERDGDMDFGQATHIAILEPGRWADSVAVIDADDWRTKAAREYREDAYAKGKVPILTEAASRIFAMQSAIHAHPIAASAFLGGEPEQSIVWQDASTGVWRKARPDFTPTHGRHLIDYKTVVSAHPRAFERHAYDMGYHQQAAWYIDGRAAVTGKRPDGYWFVCQERKPPFLVSVCRLAGDAIEWGAKLNRRALQIFAECVAANEWPGYRDPARPDADRAFDIGLPAYAAFQLAEREEGGELQARRPALPGKPSTKLLAAAMAAQAPLDMEV